jgi:hypothetical protein
MYGTASIILTTESSAGQIHKIKIITTITMKIINLTLQANIYLGYPKKTQTSVRGPVV